MRARMITAGTLIFAAGFVAGGRLEPPVGAQGYTLVMDCGAVVRPAAPHDTRFRTRATEGRRHRARVAAVLARRSDQSVSKRADRVGGGGPVADAAGSIDHEQSKVLLLVHPDTAVARQSVAAVIEAYRKTFEQQSVLWESARVCGAV